MIESEIRFCARCGSPVSHLQRFGRIRPVCQQCNWVFFPDPKVAVTVLIIQDGHILLVKRANDPQRGCWTLPGGFMDAGEDPRRAAERECLEETGLEVRVTHLLQLAHHPADAQGAHLVIYYRAEVCYGSIKAGDDAVQVKFFHLDMLPELAFLPIDSMVSLANTTGQPV